MRGVLKPRPVPRGGTVALVAAAGPLAEGAVERAEALVRALGFTPRTGAHAAGRYRDYLSGRDEERAADLNHALASDADAVWLLRGGYGTMRILERVDWSSLRERPRPVIGFSDNTALHLAMLRARVLSFHGPHAAADPFTPFSERCFRSVVLEGEAGSALPIPDGAALPAPLAGGRAEGRLVGGNLALIGATLGTPFAIRTENRILFIEDIGESLYRIDRLFTQLRLAGVLQAASGIIVGGMTGTDACVEDESDLRDLLVDRLGDLGIPVLASCPFGHLDDSWTLPVGAVARVDADAGTVTLLESPLG